MKLAALDIGDQWTGIALSDAMGIVARPHNTVETSKLIESLTALLEEERINTIVVGYPKTMRGTESDQTKKILAIADDLMIKFPIITWKLWDERLSSKRAAQGRKATTKEERLRSHAIAAAFILDSYLMYLQIHAEPTT